MLENILRIRQMSCAELGSLLITIFYRFLHLIISHKVELAIFKTGYTGHFIYKKI